jgi:hypothetical protein
MHLQVIIQATAPLAPEDVAFLKAIEMEAINPEAVLSDHAKSKLWELRYHSYSKPGLLPPILMAVDWTDYNQASASCT